MTKKKPTGQRYALLAADGVLTGFSDKPEGYNIEVPSDFDHKPGEVAYRHDAWHKVEPEGYVDENLQAVKYAVLSAEGTLQRFSREPVSPCVQVPYDCDLEPGKYQFVDGAFQPIRSKFPDAPAPKVFDTDKAVALALAAIGQTIELPEYTRQWIASLDIQANKQG